MTGVLPVHTFLVPLVVLYERTVLPARLLGWQNELFLSSWSSAPNAKSVKMPSMV